VTLALPFCVRTLAILAIYRNSTCVHPLLSSLHPHPTAPRAKVLAQRSEPYSCTFRIFVFFGCFEISLPVVQIPFLYLLSSPFSSPVLLFFPFSDHVILADTRCFFRFIAVILVSSPLTPAKNALCFVPYTMWLFLSRNPIEKCPFREFLKR